jgi:hypothetical protein
MKAGPVVALVRARVLRAQKVLYWASQPAVTFHLDHNGTPYLDIVFDKNQCAIQFLSWPLASWF